MGAHGRVASPWGLSQEEVRLFKSMRTPHGIQRFLDEELDYDLEPDGPQCRSPRLTLADGVAHCMGGALLAAAALRVMGQAPMLFHLATVRDDSHALALVRWKDGFWGAIGKSNYAGLRYREPVYRTLRELAMSYFEHYYNPAGERTLRAYSARPFHLSKFDRIGWMTTGEPLWAISNDLVTAPHTRLLPPGGERRLSRLDERSYHAGRVGMS